MANAGRKARVRNTELTMQEFLVLASLRKAGGEFVDINTVAQEMRRRARVDMETTNLYNVVRRFERMGLAFRTEEKRPRGESRHFYTLTEAGYTTLAEWFGRLTALL